MRGRYGDLLFQLLLSAFLLGVLAWRVDLHEAAGRLRAVSIPWVLAATAAFAVAQAVAAYRWRLILAHHSNIPLRSITGIYLISRLANVVVPFRGGDIARIQVAANRFQLSRAELAGTVFGVETPLNWLTMFVIVAVILLFVPVPLLPGELIAAATLVLVSAFVTAAFVSETWYPGDFSTRPVFRWLPARPVELLSTVLNRFIDGMRELRTPLRALRVFAVSLAVFGSETLVFVLLGQAFALDLPLYTYIFVTIGPNLVRTLPLTPGDVGPYEVVLAAVVSLLGETPGAAGSFAIGSHVLILLWTAILGLASARLLGLRANDLFRYRSNAQASSQPASAPARGPGDNIDDAR